MCCAASIWMASCSCSSFICSSDSFFTMTEWPDTDVATSRVLILFSAKILAMELETALVSTIAPSTTISGSRFSMLSLLTTSPLPARFSSTALTELEPMSTPTNCLPLPKPSIHVPLKNLCPPRRGGSYPALRLPSLALSLHPSVQGSLLKAPAVAQLKRRNFRCREVLVQSIRGNAKIMGSLSDIHHFA